MVDKLPFPQLVRFRRISGCHPAVQSTGFSWRTSFQVQRDKSHIHHHWSAIRMRCWQQGCLYIPDHSCMVYSPTFGWIFMVNVGKYTTHASSWILWVLAHLRYSICRWIQHWSWYSWFKDISVRPPSMMTCWFPKGLYMHVCLSSESQVPMDKLVWDVRMCHDRKRSPRRKGSSLCYEEAWWKCKSLCIGFIFIPYVLSQMVETCWYQSYWMDEIMKT